MRKEVALVFTGDEFADGGEFIAETFDRKKCKASFFFTGRFFEQPKFKQLITRLYKGGHYIGPHSYGHLLYCDWTKRDSLLIDESTFRADLQKNHDVIKKMGIDFSGRRYFIPPYEWYNDSISQWSERMGFTLFNMTPGVRTSADYTTPDMKNYKGSEEIYATFLQAENSLPNGLNGFILLIHIGTDPRRTDKLYSYLPRMIDDLRSKGYRFKTIPELLGR